MNASLLTVLGSTGSIGMNTLAVMELHPDRFKVFALTAHTQVERMVQQCIRYQPRYAVMADEQAAEQVEAHLRSLGIETTVLQGESGLIEVASHRDVSQVVAGIVGKAGLLPTLAAAKSGKRILLANKEALVMSGQLFMRTVEENHATLIPLDSEHSAIFQCLPAHFKLGMCSSVQVQRLTLTASGGALRDWPLEKLSEATPEAVAQHPNWQMGAKITVDCATMMNKGLEVIEARWLFGLPNQGIHALLHPQSRVHSFVSYTDGSVLAQLGSPDMRVCIAYALGCPERIISGVPPLDLIQMGSLEFRPIEKERYPSLSLAYAALERGGTAPTILNAANEIAVQAFLDKEIKFTDVARVVEHTLEMLSVAEAVRLETILEADRVARMEARIQVHKHRIKPSSFKKS